MKQIFTLFTAVAVLFAVQANAQTFSENFENALSSCWSNVNTSITASNKGISQQSLAFTNNGNSTLATPYLDVASGSVTIAFKYALSGKLQSGKTRTFQVGYQNKAGVFTAISAVISATATSTQTYSSTSAVASGTYRIVIRGTADGSNDFILIDDMTVDASYHYGASICNSAPSAGNDNFSTLLSTPYSGNVLGNDSDPNAGESITASIVTAPAATVGTVSLSSNGNFTFTPAVGFAGGPVTFTYKLTDNGFDPLSSNTATVTINYPELAPLPIQLVSFSGSLVNNKAQVKWLVEENETGSHFEIEKSNDGKAFFSIGVVMVSDKSGSENYSYMETSELSGEAYYRLKIVNKNNSVSQSRIIVLKNQKGAKSNSLVIMQNPVQSTLTFNYTATKAGVSAINIYNLSGVKVLTTNLNAQAGLNSLSLGVDNKLTSGAYVLEVVNGTERNIAKIIKK